MPMADFFPNSRFLSPTRLVLFCFGWCSANVFSPELSSEGKQGSSGGSPEDGARRWGSAAASAAAAAAAAPAATTPTPRKILMASGLLRATRLPSPKTILFPASISAVPDPGALTPSCSHPHRQQRHPQQQQQQRPGCSGSSSNPSPRVLPSGPLRCMTARPRPPRRCCWSGVSAARPWTAAPRCLDIGAVLRSCPPAPCYCCPPARSQTRTLLPLLPPPPPPRTRSPGPWGKATITSACRRPGF